MRDAIPDTPTEWVYAVRQGNYIKIGLSRNVANRLRELQTSSPEPLHLVGTFAGGRRLERLLHQRFADHRVRGEWFSLRILPELLDMLAEEDTFRAAA